MTSLLSLGVILNFFLLSKSVLCSDCNFFNNITVRVTPNHTLWGDFRKVTGCFEPKKFSDVVSGLSIFDQDSIAYIGDHAVHDLQHLIQITILDNHNIKNLSASAFENLPMLTTLQISDTRITNIETGTFKNLTTLEFLDLENNQISELPTEAFGVKPSLEYVILTNNKISDIDHLWFQYCPMLRYLSFNRNKIQMIRNNAFQFTPNLIELFLDFNEITVIEETAFHYLKDMEILSIVHNKLVKLDPNVVPENFRVHRMDLRANFLNFLSKDLLSKLSVDFLDIAGNPLECACLDGLHDWMLQKNVTSENDKEECRTEPVPQCFDGPDPIDCSEELDPKSTELFVKRLKTFDFRIYPKCANLS